ncbi:hypothetical protein [Hyphomonas sp.]|uniref:hypothetical protein n=1 Tax=Hyphomonas sp. TaxID=87 RepID=UPI0025C122B6|nr:hypothetical protein [Hyphomonas sp.]MBI1401468.1 hypothetical protein [Hyphomonas sp.]
MAKQTFPAAWGLTPLEAAYLKALRPGAVVPAEKLAALHAAPLSPKSARVRKTMQALRRKLDPLDIEIETKWREGWQLGRAGRAKLTAALKP